MVEKYPDATLPEYCEYWGENSSSMGSTSTMCRALQTTIDTKKKALRSVKAQQKESKNSEVTTGSKSGYRARKLGVLDEMGVLLGLTRTHARSFRGIRVYDLKPFYRGAKVTVIGAVSLKQVLAVMTLNSSMDGEAFKVFVEKCLAPQLWPGAVVVMDNVPAHKVTSIEPLIQSVGASVLYLSPYSPDFIRLNIGGHNLRLFCVSFLQPQQSGLIL
jgi:transposase